MNTLPADHGGWSLSADPRQYGISNTRSDHNLTNNIYGDSNANVGNVSHSYNTINMGVDEESLRIQAWLSPLGHDGRHRDISTRRLDGIGDWVLQGNEQCSQPASPSGFGYGRTDPGFFRDGRAGLRETGFPKKKPGPAWVTCRPQVFNPNLNLQKAISTD